MCTEFSKNDTTEKGIISIVLSTICVIYIIAGLSTLTILINYTDCRFLRYAFLRIILETN
jgi:hypothetical protein